MSDPVAAQSLELDFDAFRGDSRSELIFAGRMGGQNG
jgi:hypothetical protein